MQLITPQWTAPANVVAYTSTRSGGVSAGPYESLNVGEHVGDDPSFVAHNRELLPHHHKLIWLNQVHGNRCLQLPATDNEADAAISRTRQQFCAVMTADCVPVLVCDEAGTEVAAIHAGWQGLEKGVIAATLNAMHTPSHKLLAWIGPAISVQHYEVDASLAARFGHWPEAVQAHENPHKAWLDLPKIAQLQLHQCGVGLVWQSALCTYANDQQFFSHRRAQHQGLSNTGRQVSVIGLI